MKKKITLSYVLSQFTLLFLAVLVIYPLFFVLMTSVKSNFDVLTNPFTIHSFKPHNYIEAWKLVNGSYAICTDGGYCFGFVFLW